MDGAIQNYTKQLVTGGGSMTALSEALMFVVHFAGDIHQPLHVGFDGVRVHMAHGSKQTGGGGA